MSLMYWTSTRTGQTANYVLKYRLKYRLRRSEESYKGVESELKRKYDKIRGFLATFPPADR